YAPPGGFEARKVPFLWQGLERKITDYAAYGVAAASITSSSVRSPVRGVLTSTAMLPGGCRLVRINSCACGILVQGNNSLMQGSMRRSSTNWLAAEACLRCAKCEPCTRFCRIHTYRASRVRL